MENKKSMVWTVGTLIVVVTVLLNLGPYLLIANTQLWMVSMMIIHPIIYYALAGIFMLPIGTILSSVVGNKTTGFLTFALSSFVFVVMGDIASLAVSFLIAVICCFVYDNAGMPKWLGIIVTSCLISLTVIGIGRIWGSFSTSTFGIVQISMFVLLYSTVFVGLGFLLERVPFLKAFDEKTRDLDRNYRVHSLNRKLIIVINVICIVLVTVFAVVAIILLANKEEERREAEESIWTVVLYNAIEDDAPIFAERNQDKIKDEAEKIRIAFESGNISIPAHVVITTNVEETFYQQIYEVTFADALSDQIYEVEWLGETVLDKSVTDRMIFLPHDGNSSLAVTEQSKTKENILDAIRRIVSVALVLMVLMNVIVSAYIRKNIVRPINRMTSEAMDFAFNSIDTARSERVEITSGDEIESLSKAFHKTMNDVEAYIEDVQKKSQALSDMQHNIIITMADIIESRDLNTGGHIKRTALYVGIIADKLMKDGQFADTLTEEYMKDMIVAAPLHDMGKIHVPDQILNKNGKLTDEEFAVMKSHAAVGKELLDTASESLGDFKYLIIAKQMAESHHEWWNGNGYPDKASGEDIPLCARIMAVADVFDALVSKRCYKEPMDLDVAFGIIEKETGTHFDPIIGKAFLDCRPEVEKTLAQLQS